MTRLHQEINSLSLQLNEAGQAAREREAKLVYALEFVLFVVFLMYIAYSQDYLVTPYLKYFT